MGGLAKDGSPCSYTRVIGCDASLTCTGISDGDRTELIKTTPGPEDAGQLTDLSRRVEDFIDGVAEFICISPVVIYLEAPLLNGPQANHLREAGHLERALVSKFGADRIVLVPPSTLKKFIAGNGSAKKKHSDGEAKPCVICAVKERHGISFASDPGVDKLHAWALWKFGTDVERGNIIYTPPARRGKGKKQLAKQRRAETETVVSVGRSSRSGKANSARIKRSRGDDRSPTCRKQSR